MKQLYFNKQQHDLALLMIEYQDYASPDAKIRALNVRDRGICLYMCQRYQDSLQELQGYLTQFPDAVDHDAINTVMQMCRDAQQRARGGEGGSGGASGDAPPPSPTE